jgi:hypothetical protein
MNFTIFRKKENKPLTSENPPKRSKSFCKHFYLWKILLNSIFFLIVPSNKKSQRKKIISNEKKEEHQAKIEKKRLPNNFAEDVLILEIEMERKNVQIQKLNKLLELYAVTSI